MKMFEILQKKRTLSIDPHTNIVPIILYTMNIFSFNRGGKKAGAGSARINTGPYLDQISQGYHGNFKSIEAHKKLLIQPVQIPNLDHCRVNSEFVSVNKKHSEPFDSFGILSWGGYGNV